MKKILVLLVAFLVCLPGFSGNDWMETSNGKIECKDINLRLKKVNAVLEDGQKVDVSYHDINSFSRNGEVYVKLRLYEGNKPTNKLAFMELVGTWNNLNLYRLAVKNLELDESNRYYLYEGSKYHMQLDNRSLKNTCNAFGLNYAEL